MTAMVHQKSQQDGVGLVLDTAANFCAVAVFDLASGQLLSKKVDDIGTGHAEVLMEFIEDATSKAKIALHAIGAVATVIGPGSFTGIRVGVSTARGLALALGVPSFGITTLDALRTEAALAVSEKPVMAAIDARRGEIYTALYASNGEELSAAAVTTLEQANALAKEYQPTLVGSGASAIGALLPAAKIVHLRATAEIETYALCAAKAFVRGSLEKPKPLYLRAPDAKPQAGFIIERR